MKKLLCLLVFAGWSSLAQVTVLQMAPTNTVIAPLGTNTMNLVVPCDNSLDLTLQLNFALMAAPGVNSNITVNLQTSLDQSNWTDWKQLTILSTGTSTATLTTNYTLGSLPYVRIRQLVNANTNAVTNLVVWRGLKRIR